MWKTISSAGVTILLALAVQASPDKSVTHDYEFAGPAAVSPTRLADEVQAALGISLMGKDQDGYFEIAQQDDATSVRIVMLQRDLSADEQAQMGKLIAAHVASPPLPTERQVRAAAGPRQARRALFRERYAQAKTDAERMVIMAEYIGLKAP